MHRYGVACVWLVCVIARASPVLAQQADSLSVPVRIHDYVRLPPESIRSAQERVGDLYATIGVHPAWAETVRKNDLRVSALERDPSDPRELLVVILPKSMSRRLAIGARVIGLAAVTQFEGGRVAYVLFDRVCEVATAARTDPAGVLGVIIAHELGHLLLPSGSHSPNGLMRSQWRPVDFGAPTHAELSFTSTQAHDIRGLLGRMWRPAFD